MTVKPASKPNASSRASRGSSRASSSTSIKKPKGSKKLSKKIRVGPESQTMPRRPKLGNPFLEAYLGKPVVLPSSGVNGLRPLPSEDTFVIDSNDFDLAIHPAYDGLAILRTNDNATTAAQTAIDMQRSLAGNSGPNLLAGAQVPLLSDATAVRASTGTVYLAPLMLERHSGALMVPENKGSSSLHRHMYEIDVAASAFGSIFNFDAKLGRTLSAGESVTAKVHFFDSGLSTVASYSSTAATNTNVLALAATAGTSPDAKWLGLELEFVLESAIQMRDVGIRFSGSIPWTANLSTRALFVDRSTSVEGVSRGARTIFSRLCGTLSYTGDLVKSGTIASTVLPAAATGSVLMSYNDITTDTTIRYRTGSVGEGCHLTSALNNVSQHYFDTEQYSQFHPNWASLFFAVRANDPDAQFRLRIGAMLHVIPTVQYHTVEKKAYVQHQLDEFGTIMSTMPLMMENPSHLKTLATYVRHAIKDAPEYAQRLGDIAQAVTNEVIRVKGMAGTLL